MGLINLNQPMSKNECIEILEKRGISIIYEPRVLFPESRNGELVEMSVFDAVYKLGLWDQTNSIFKKKH